MSNKTYHQDIYMNTIGFTGTRRGVSTVRIEALESFLRVRRAEGFTMFRHGDCQGADEQAHHAACRAGYWITLHPPSDARHRAYCQAHTTLNAKPYLQRNRHIVDHSDILVALPVDPARSELQSGTWSTVRYARNRCIPVYLF